MFPKPLWHLQLQSEALRTKASVESLFGLFLGIQNQKYANSIPKRAELFRKDVWTVLCHTEKRIMWLSVKFGNDKQRNSKFGAIKLGEPCKAQHFQLCNFVNSACRLVIIGIMHQCQEMNLAQMTRTYEIILQKRQLSCFMVGWSFEVSFSLQFLCVDSCFPRL